MFQIILFCLAPVGILSSFETLVLCHPSFDGNRFFLYIHSCLNETTMKQVLVMAKIGRPIKFVIRLTPEERTRLEGMIHCGIGALNSAL